MPNDHERPRHPRGRHAGIDKTTVNVKEASSTKPSQKYRRSSTSQSRKESTPSLPQKEKVSLDEEIVGIGQTLDPINPDGSYERPTLEVEDIERVELLDEWEEEQKASAPARKKFAEKSLASPSAAGIKSASQTAKVTGKRVSHTAEQDKPEVGSAEAVGASAALISICVIISRITGFGRTWAMAFALGSTFLSSTYQVANNLPNMLYELVMGGMLVTAFLPVYMTVKKKLGNGAGNDYASNLLTIVVVILGIVSVLCIIFPAQVIYTQSFYSDQNEMGMAVFFFQFFAIQVVFYGAAAIVSGLLNANREYFWPSIAPVFNNVIVIVTFLMYAGMAVNDQNAALYVIAIGNPLGVFIQMAIQIPALAKQGIHIRPRIDFHDPGLRDTLRIGAPALAVTVCEFVTVSVTNAAAYAFVDNGPSVIAYARLWFTFPYSFLAVPVTTAMFTELADMEADGNREGVIHGIMDGSRQIFFLMIPMAMYLIVFSTPLVTLYHVGAFTEEAVGQIALYLTVMAVALPFYGVNTYLQKVFSSIRRMGVFSLLNLVAVMLQVAITAGSAAINLYVTPLPMEMIAVGTIAAYLIGDIIEFIYLKVHFGHIGFGSIAVAFLRALILGAFGALVGAGVLYVLETFIAPISGSLLQAFIYIVIAGICSLICTFGPAIKMNLPEASFINGVAARLLRVLHR